MNEDDEGFSGVEIFALVLIGVVLLWCSFK